MAELRHRETNRGNDDPEFIAATAAKLPLGDLGEYIAFRSREDRQRLAEDAGFVVGWEDMRRRLIRWEDFERHYPNLPETRTEVKPEVIRTVGWYLFGIDNSPAYDRWPVPGPKTVRLDAKLRASYARFIEENRTSAFHAVIAGIYGILRRHNFSPDAELFAFLRGHLTDPEHRRRVDWLERRLAER